MDFSQTLSWTVIEAYFNEKGLVRACTCTAVVMELGLVECDGTGAAAAAGEFSFPLL